MIRQVFPGRTITENDLALTYYPADLLSAAVALNAAPQMAWGKPKVGKPKRNKTRSRMAAQSRKRNRK